ncbi:MAG: glucosidase [Planctomycetota bacterium]|nr:glucosidase [Planctomycetota bacterium]
MPQKKSSVDPESQRLADDAARTRNWKRFGPYLAARQWGTVREDYSADGDCWRYFPHEHARSRAYRWGEDGLLGWTDRQCRICFSIALWNGRDPILKERLYGLVHDQGNHGEDVKEEYYFLESSPTHSWCKALYKYPQAEFPYARLVEENQRRSRAEPEFELVDTGIFDGDRHFDVAIEYAKAGEDDTCIRIRVTNRGPESAALHVLPTVWFRNSWSWGCSEEGCDLRPRLRRLDDHRIQLDEPTLGRYEIALDEVEEGTCELLFTENESNLARLYQVPNSTPFVKDAFHEHVVNGRKDAVNPAGNGTKAAWNVRFEIAPGQSRVLNLRLCPAADARKRPFGATFDQIFTSRRSEYEAFHALNEPADMRPEERAVVRQAYAGLLWSKQFYHYAVDGWLQGDKDQPAPPESRKEGRNHEWRHLHARDVLSMPDTWEYPWFAAWDSAFHMVAMARVDPQFAKDQLLLFLREWYMAPNGAIPAYEFQFSDVNPPVHAWACWRVYKMTGGRGGRDRKFLARAFHKLLLNFTWWVNRKDPEGNNLFSGGFLGLDNIGIFDRSRPLPGGAELLQADGTAWMAFYCLTMLAIAVELAQEDDSYEDVASKFFEHFVGICDAMNKIGGCGLWDEVDGFYHDVMMLDGKPVPLRVRSMVGLVPLIACSVITEQDVAGLPHMRKRVDWFLKNRRDLAEGISYFERNPKTGRGLLAIPSRERLERVLQRVFDETEFLSPHGLRSLSKAHEARPFAMTIAGEDFRAEYEPGETKHRIFGGNSNWRGPVWFPLNYLIAESLRRYHHFYGSSFTVEIGRGSGVRMDLRQASFELERRLASLFLADGQGHRPCHGGDPRYANRESWKDLVLFHEYFHGDTGKGLGASHQTGWTALAARCLEDLALDRARSAPSARK